MSIFIEKIKEKYRKFDKIVDTWLDNKWLTIKGWLKEEWVSAVVQIGIGFCLLITFIITCQSIRQQGEFNRRLLQPWLLPKPFSQVIVVDDSITYGVCLKNKGRSPALNGTAGVKINFSDKFPYILPASPTPRYFIFPEDSSVLEKTQKLTHSDYLKLPKDTIINLIQEGKVFLHSYISYEDYAQNKYEFIATFILKLKIPQIAENTYECVWGDINQSYW